MSNSNHVFQIQTGKVQIQTFYPKAKATVKMPKVYSKKDFKSTFAVTSLQDVKEKKKHINCQKRDKGDARCIMQAKQILIITSHPGPLQKSTRISYKNLKLYFGERVKRDKAVGRD